MSLSAIVLTRSSSAAQYALSSCSILATPSRITISLDPLIAVEAYGNFFLAPPNPEIYLEKKYGKNWRTPDKKQFIWNKNKFKEKL